MKFLTLKRQWKNPAFKFGTISLGIVLTFLLTVLTFFQQKFQIGDCFRYPESRLITMSRIIDIGWSKYEVMDCMGKISLDRRGQNDPVEGVKLCSWKYDGLRRINIKFADTFFLPITCELNKKY